MVKAHSVMNSDLTRHFSRRRFLAALSALGGIALSPGCAEQKKPLSIAISSWPGFKPLLLARQQEWLDPRLVRLTELPSSSSCIYALTSGTVDGVALSLDEVFWLRALNVPLRIVWVVDVSEGGDMLLAKPGIKSLHELRGQRIALDRDTNAAFILAKALHRVGLTVKDVNVVSTTIGDVFGAWGRHEVDAAVCFGPVSDQLLQVGARRLFDSREIPTTLYRVLAVRSALLESPEFGGAIRHVLGAHLRALDAMQSSINGGQGISAASSDPSLRGVKLLGLKENRSLLTGDSPSLLAHALPVFDFLVESGLVPYLTMPADLICADFLPRVP